MNIKKYRNDILSAFIVLVVCLIILFYAIPSQISISSSFSGDIGVNSRTFPQITIGLMGFLAIIQIIVSSIKLQKEKAKEFVEENKDFYIKGEIIALTIYVLFVLFAVLMRYVNTICALLIIPLLMLAAMGEKKKSHYLIVLAFSIVAYLVFKYVLGVYLP
jgi:hypothetical protein